MLRLAMAGLGILWFGVAPVHAASVRIYAGPRTAAGAVIHTRLALQDALNGRYDVVEVDPVTLQGDGWQADTALLVMPGGRDLPYLASLGAEGGRHIRNYVQAGGAYLGLCAGGYFGAADIVFHPDDANFIVRGPRPLGFFPGTCQGPVWPEFAYDGERDAHAAPLLTNDASLTIYHNGGGAFLEAARYENVEVLARYAFGAQEAAVVLCHLGSGAAVLTGVHPEFDPWLLAESTSYAPGVLQRLRNDDVKRREFLKALLQRLGL